VKSTAVRSAEFGFQKILPDEFATFTPPETPTGIVNECV